MPITTTCIGAYPKPDYVKLPDWFTAPAHPDAGSAIKQWADALADLGPDTEALLDRAVQEVITDQVQAGIDIPTDGEIPRENYVHYHCRHLDGIDFSLLDHRIMRNGSYEADLPTITGPIRAQKPFLVKDWQRAQNHTSNPVKITIPGPMTITDTTADVFYNEPKKLGVALAQALNHEVLALAAAGCRYIQIDEPLFARKPAAALSYGIENLERAFHGCPPEVIRVSHMCCGYPDRLDQPNYVKADPLAYLQLADAIEDSTIMAVSLEDAHRHNDLALLEHFHRTSVIFGVVAIADSRVESVDEIRQRLLQVLEHIDNERLLAAPDCGLGFLDRKLALKKLHNLGVAARSVQ